MEINKNELQGLLDEWLQFREEDISHLTEEDKKYLPRFEKRIGEVLNFVHPINRECVNSILEDMYDSIMGYSGHWDRKYYKTGFADGIKLI